MKSTVCHIITMLELGGAQQNTLYTVSHLNREMFQSLLICGEGGLLDEEAKSFKDVPVRFLSSLQRSIHPWRDLKAFMQLYSILKREKPDIVHTHSSKAGILGRWAAFLSGVPVIIHTIHGFGFHGEQPLWKRGLFIFLERITSSITSTFIAVSKDNIRTGKKLSILSERQVRLIRSGITLNRFNSQHDRDGFALRRSLGIPVDAPLVGMVGCFKPQKSPLDFVKIASEVLKKAKEAHFIMVGDGELREKVEEERERRFLKERLHLLGWRRDMPAIMKALDVLVLPSLWEGLPRVIPEAMASGKPVVASSIDGAKDIIKDGETGFLALPHDIERFASRVCLLLEDQGLRQRMIQESQKCLQEFDIDAMVRQQEELYDALIQHEA
jgi:glycosyltransferase involved in cell wall biosynthesis